MLALGQRKSPRKRRGQKEAQPSARARRALAPPAWFGRSPPAPPTHPLRPATRASPPGGPEGPREAGSGRAGSGPRGLGAGGARRGQLGSPGGPCPGAAGGRLASPPRGSRRRAAPSAPHGRPPPPPRARPARAPAAPGFRVGLRGLPEARVRAESSGSEFAIPRAGIRAPSVPPPSPTRGLLLSSGAAPDAPWRPPREAPAPNPPSLP